MHFDDAALEYVVAELIQHLRLCGMHNVTEIHVIGHLTFERHFHRFWDRHCCSPVASAKATVPESAPNATPLDIRVAVAANDDRPIIDCDVIQNLVNNVCHWMIDAFWIAACDQAEIMHEFHQTRCVLPVL